MGVETPSADYTKYAKHWQRARDVVAGESAMQEAGVAYVPKLKGQTPVDYAGYLRRAPFYNATARTINGLLGMVFRQPTITKTPSGINEYMKDVTLAGDELEYFIKKVAREDITVGRSGILVDHPEVKKNPDGSVPQVTVAQAAQLGLRPTLTLYTAENILDAQWGRVENRTTLTTVRLREFHNETASDFTVSTKEKIRVLQLLSGVYTVSVYVKTGNGRDAKYNLESTTTPTMNGQPMNFIPFDVCRDIEEPPLLDLINMNVSHYRTTVDYEHGCHFTGLPQPWISGYRATPGETITIGSTSVWVFPDPGAQAGYLQLAGDFAALSANLDRKEKQMAVLGARMLEPQIRGVESAEAASIHRKGEESMLADFSQSTSKRMTRVLQWFADWAMATGEVSVEVNRDFYPVPMTAMQLTALVAAWQSGAISEQVLFENLQQGEVISEGTTLEEEQARKSAVPPQIANNPASTGAA